LFKSESERADTRRGALEANRRTAITDSDVAAAVEISTATTNRLQPPVVMSAQVELNPSADDTIIAAMNTTDMEYTSSEYV